MEVGLGGLWAAAWVAGETDREGNLFAREISPKPAHTLESAWRQMGCRNEGPAWAAAGGGWGEAFLAGEDWPAWGYRIDCGRGGVGGRGRG